MAKGQTRTLIFFAIFLFVIGLIVNYVPIYWEGKSLTAYLSDITGLPEQDLFFPSFIWMFMLPLIGSTAMVLAIINMATGWFVADKNLNLVIALSWMGVIMATPLRYLIWGIFTSLGIYAIGVWGFFFIFGSFVMARKFYKAPEKYLMLSSTKNIANLTAEYNRLLVEHKAAMDAHNYKKAAEIRRKMEDIQAELKFIERKQRELATGEV
jgi:hypothetical protein